MATHVLKPPDRAISVSIEPVPAASPAMDERDIRERLSGLEVKLDRLLGSCDSAGSTLSEGSTRDPVASKRANSLIASWKAHEESKQGRAPVAVAAVAKAAVANAAGQAHGRGWRAARLKLSGILNAGEDWKNPTTPPESYDDAEAACNATTATPQAGPDRHSLSYSPEAESAPDPEKAAEAESAAEPDASRLSYRAPRANTKQERHVGGAGVSHRGTRRSSIRSSLLANPFVELMNLGLLLEDGDQGTTRRRAWLICMPWSRSVLLWDTLIGLLVLVIAVEQPMRLAFGLELITNNFYACALPTHTHGACTDCACRATLPPRREPHTPLLLRMHRATRARCMERALAKA